MLLSTVAAALGLASSAHAWGKLGHETAANVAFHYLHKGVKEEVNNILEGHGGEDISDLPSIVRVAAWADGYAHSHAGAWSKTHHFIDIADQPPNACNQFDTIDRVCSKGCVVMAIADHTRTLLERTKSDEDIAQALMFVIHFLGDITQPLHAEGYKRGGNNITIWWGGKVTNLHHIWDDEMVFETAGGHDLKALDRWTSEIIQEIEGGSYKDFVQDWSSCTDFDDLLRCPKEWAKDTNKLVCQYAIPHEFNECSHHHPEDCDQLGKEDDYYEKAKPIIQQQIAKAGIRLAAWLNQIFHAPGGSPTSLRENRLKLQSTEQEIW